ATPQLRLERLLREQEVAIGLLVSEQAVRLVYAPRGESTGHITFPLAFMMEPAGRPVMAAFLALLCDERVIGVGAEENQLALMQKSREFQNEVSEQLAQQVLGALHALVRGIQAADERSGQTLLRAVLEEDPQHIYGGLLAVLLRLVFLLYAEDRGLLPGDGVYTRHYSVHALFERLRADAAMHPDTMDQRFGAWAQLLTVFRLVHGGAFWGEEAMPPRRGHLFNPDTYAFLEGRLEGSHASRHQRFDPPKVSDGVVLDVLRALLMLGDERLSYRTLDVEQIGSVYEYMMGFELERSTGATIAIKAGKVPVFIDLDELVESDKARKHLEGEYGIKVSTKVGKALGSADDHHEIVEALGKKIHEITPAPLPPGSLYLQPGEERRKSGSHYTPRELTAPIVEHTL
ncbi:MAG: class I SAM-dependent DNA methyltransferase, partial [Myxococcota bacterium]|nr:class I SAM-dependent DNA methyltransferase [Myxococcota bacterium]